MTDLLSIPFTSIIVPERYRKDYGDISGLQASLKNIGSIHPIVLSQNSDNTYTLIAGGRRHACMKALKIKELFHASIGNPERLGFVFDTEIPETRRKEMELDENMYRLATKWQEDVLLIDDIHKMKRQQTSTKWGARHTAAMLGPGYSKSSVNLVLNVAKLVRAGHPEILAASGVTEANVIRLKLAEDKGLAEMSKRMLAKVPAKPSTESFLESFSIDLKPKKEGDATCAAHAEKAPQYGVKSTAVPGSAATKSNPSPAAEPVTIPLSTMFLLGDQRQTRWPEVDHIVTDIPYGIDMDNLDEKAVADVKDTHGVEQNVDMMHGFLMKAFQSIRSGGFCVFFYDLDHHEKLQKWAKDVGFRVQRWPFVAVKSSPCRNQAAQYNTTKNFECAMFLRKDEKTVLRKPVPSSWKAYNFRSEQDLYNNPFAKPSELWKDIYEAVAFKGQSVLDPFAGEMSACRAAANFGLTPYGIEISEQHYNRGLQHMRNVYELIHKGNVLFT